MDENKHVRYVLVEVIERDISEPVFAETADAARDAMRQMVCQAVGADEDTPWDDVLEETTEITTTGKSSKSDTYGKHLDEILAGRIRIRTAHPPARTDIRT